ncbi:mRNA capping enzyme [Crassisporium funariophilum]|nr:mRNA capping enzyme [Crassisporium funariophilum]
MPIPDLPGVLVPRYSEHEKWLKSHVARMCQLDHERFPGSQPVSFGVRDLAKLENQDYWVCEKSDGIRVLFLVVTDWETKDQSVFIIDRHNTYRRLEGLFFPHHENPMMPLRSSLIDGELVIDVDPRTRQERCRFLAFDCLVINDQNVMARTLDKRYGRLTEWFYKPYAKMVRDHPRVMETQPFDIKVKEINFSYHVEKVFNVDIPALHHGNDGLIYTCVSTPYTPGTDTNILKWKPPSENSIDFKLVLRFPPSRYNSNQPDYHAKPVFLLHVWCGDERGTAKYEQYDDMYVDDEEWEELKKSGEQIDDRIVEVHWDLAISRWRMMRFRDDKPNGNHRSVVENIIQSIAEGVEKETLLGRSNAIRSAWKSRLGQPPQQPSAAQAPQSQQQHPHPQMMRPPPLPAIKARPTTPSSSVEMRYGPLAPSRWSKVAGPPVISGMKR